MIRIREQLTQLQEDAPEIAARVYAAGWRIDEDSWWVRPMRKTDRGIRSSDVTGDWFVVSQHVFAPSADVAAAFDAESAP